MYFNVEQFGTLLSYFSVFFESNWNTLEQRLEQFGTANPSF
jgi:hypothetical protein